MEKLSDRMTLIIEEFIQIERELTKQNAKLGTEGVFFYNSFQLDTPGDPDAACVDILTTLECVHHLLEDYETQQKDARTP